MLPFKNPIKLAKHMVEIDGNNDVWKCNICNKTSYDLVLPASFMFFEYEKCSTDEEILIKDIIE